MSEAFGGQFARNTLDLLFGASGTVYLALHADDPGSDGQGGINEFPATNGYARAAIAEGDWAAAVDFSVYHVKSNANAIAFPATAGAWASGNPVTWIALWKSLAGTDASDFIARMPMQTPVAITDAGKIPTFDVGQVQIAFTAPP